MATMTVSLPDSLRDWIENEYRAGGHATSSEYLLDLVCRDRERKDGLAGLRNLIDEAEASGISSSSLSEIFADARNLARSRASNGE